MNWDQFEGKWNQLKGSAKQKWGKFTDDDLEYIAGHRDILVGKLQERYGYAKEEAQKKAEEWVKSVSFDGKKMGDQTKMTDKGPSSSVPPQSHQQTFQQTGKR
jgi:uncharacterized protein YjbJ (UPF0337 family)